MDMNVEINNSTNHLDEIEQIAKNAAQEKERQRVAHNKYVTTYVKCPCSCSVMRCNMSTHKRTKKHCLLMSTIRRSDELESQIITFMKIYGKIDEKNL